MNQKKSLKILVISIILILAIFGMSLNAYASIKENTDTQTITVSGVESGVNVSIYRLATVNYDYTADQPKEPPYAWVTEVDEWLKKEGNPYSTYADMNVFSAVTDTNTIATFYDALASAIKGKTITLEATATETAEGTLAFPVTADKKVEFTNVEMGTYLVLIENGYRVYRPSVVNVTPTYDTTAKSWVLTEATAEIKSSTPSITQTVTDTTKTSDNYSTTDTITYTIKADVPTYLGSSLAENYYISAVLANGLNLDDTSIKVYGVTGTSETKLTSGYTLTTENATRPNNAGDASYVLNFTYDDIKAYSSIKVEYTASLDQSDLATLGTTGNTSVAYLDYSNNPYTANSLTSQTSNTVKVYTYGIAISKVDKANTATTLTGAEFTLSNLYFVKTADGTYYKASSTDTGAIQTIAVDANGKLYIYGLDEGTYTLTETKAPEGYNLSNTTYDITIADADVNGTIDADTEDGNNTDGVISKTVTNSQGFSLPVTGGVGTVIFAAGGTLCMGIGVILLVVLYRRKRETK